MRPVKETKFDKSNYKIIIRQIENGFIICESWLDKKGDGFSYVSKEFYTKENPLKGVKDESKENIKN